MFTLFLTICLNYVCTIQPIGHYPSADACYADSLVIVSKQGGALTCSPKIEQKRLISPGICMRGRHYCAVPDNEV